MKMFRTFMLSLPSSLFWLNVLWVKCLSTLSNN